MGGAAGGTAGDYDFGQGSVGDTCLPDGLHHRLEHPLAVPDALLAGGGPDAGHAVFKLGDGAVGGGGNHLLRLIGVQVNDIQRLVGGDADLSPRAVLQQLIELPGLLHGQDAPDGMVLYGEHAGLLLGDGPGG